MDFSRGSEVQNSVKMDHIDTRTGAPHADHKGLDLSNSVLDRLSQKVMRLGSTKILHIFFLKTNQIQPSSSL